MGTPLMHAENSVKKYGGCIDDYLEIHSTMDSSGSGMGDKRHRAATHNTWFINEILPLIFSAYIINSAGKMVGVVQIGKDHILEDFGDKFIPTLSDWLMNLEWASWMDNGNGYPPSAQKTENIIERGKLKEWEDRVINYVAID